MAVRPSARAGLLAIVLLLAGCGLSTRSRGPRPALPRGVLSVDTYIHEEDQSPDLMDRLAAEQFRAILAAIVPDDVLPTEAELTEAVRANWPTEIGDGWILDFNGNHILRVLIVRYLEPGG